MPAANEKTATCLVKSDTAFFIYLFIYYFIYLFTSLFNVGHTIVTRLIKTNLKNTDIIDKNFKIFDMQHNSSESFVHSSISV